MEVETKIPEDTNSGSDVEKEVLDDEKQDDSVQGKENKNKKEKKKSTPGIIYLSRVPKKMNVKIIREYFSKFGEIDRIYLEPEEQKRKKQARSFKEGWVEFKKRKIAKQVCKELNSSQVGGKRRNPWYFELWNIKYLKNFRWTHLNEKMAYEQEARKQRLRQEIALAKKETNFYIQNVEKNEKKKRLEKKFGKNNESDIIENDSREKDVKQDVNTNTANNNNNNSDNEDGVKNKKHPKFDRKVKVAGNDSFLKQIFS